MTTEESNTLRICEKRSVRKIYGPVKKGERWRIRISEI
jgi:hypothetical protein